MRADLHGRSAADQVGAPINFSQTRCESRSNTRNHAIRRWRTAFLKNPEGMPSPGRGGVFLGTTDEEVVWQPEKAKARGRSSNVAG